MERRVETQGSCVGCVSLFTLFVYYFPFWIVVDLIIWVVDMSNFCIGLFFPFFLLFFHFPPFLWTRVLRSHTKNVFIGQGAGLFGMIVVVVVMMIGPCCSMSAVWGGDKRRGGVSATIYMNSCCRFLHVCNFF